MSVLKPFFGYFGGKYRIAKHYPPPRHNVIVEPFAGGAGYSLNYSDRNVILVEKSPEVAAVWDFLIHARAHDVLQLPLLAADQTVDDLTYIGTRVHLTQEAKWLIGMNIHAGSDMPCKRLSAFAIAYRPPWPHGYCDLRCRHRDETYKYRNAAHGDYENFWGPKRRARIARQVGAISHWRVICGDYTEADSVVGNAPATWYIDPPYEVAGKAYKHHALDRVELAAWCRSRRGQVIVCEADGAMWLPFSLLGQFKATPGLRRKGTTAEAIWLGGTE